MVPAPGAGMRWPRVVMWLGGRLGVMGTGWRRCYGWSGRWRRRYDDWSGRRGRRHKAYGRLHDVGSGWRAAYLDVDPAFSGFIP